MIAINKLVCKTSCHAWIPEMRKALLFRAKDQNLETFHSYVSTLQGIESPDLQGALKISFLRLISIDWVP